MKRLITFFLLFVIISFKIYSTPSNKDLMRNDLIGIKYNLSMNYAPLQWKHQYLGWDLESAFEKASQDIDEKKTITSEDYHYVVKKFLGSLHDYHVHVDFYARDYSFFPLTIKRAEGRYFVTSVWDNYSYSDDYMHDLQTKQFDLILPGTEILEIQGMPIDEYIKNIIKNELGEDDSDTGYSLATAMIFKRLGKNGHHVPTGDLTITFLDNKSQVHHGVYPWYHQEETLLKRAISEEMLVEEKILETEKDSLLKKISKKVSGNFSVDWTRDFVATQDTKQYEEQRCKIKLGSIIWTGGNSDAPAYIYVNDEGKKIGYLAIPTFLVDDEEQALEYIKSSLIKIKQEASGLVLDITNNPGGSLTYMYEVLSLVSNKTIIPPIQQVMMTPKIIHEALDFKEMLESHFPKEQLQFMPYYQYFCKLISCYEQNMEITDPLYLLGIDQITPDEEVMFDKPILLLINELDFSCGDFFPAMIQDHEIATLFGKKTAGAGGAVFYYAVESKFGVAGYSLTGTIGYRKNGDLIENLGVTPDIYYEKTINDVINDNVDYKNAINLQMKQMIK